MYCKQLNQTTMSNKLSNTQKVNEIKKILEERLSGCSTFDLIYIIKDITAIIYDLTPEEIDKIINK